MNKTNCQIWINNTAQGTTENYGGTYTGCVGDSVGAERQWNTESNQPAQCDPDKRWNTGGVKASTTGNMYGIYDMSGGTWEILMGVIVNKEDSGVYIASSGFTDDSGQETSLPNSKYYDLYTFGDTYETPGRGHFGDATKEPLSRFGQEYGAWKWKYSGFPYVDSTSITPWFTRGGDYCWRGATGVLTMSYHTGELSWNKSFRSVLSAA